MDVIAIFIAIKGEKNRTGETLAVSECLCMGFFVVDGGFALSIGIGADEYLSAIEG